MKNPQETLTNPASPFVFPQCRNKCGELCNSPEAEELHYWLMEFTSIDLLKKFGPNGEEKLNQKYTNLKRKLPSKARQDLQSDAWFVLCGEDDNPIAQSDCSGSRGLAKVRLMKIIHNILYK